MGIAPWLSLGRDTHIGNGKRTMEKNNAGANVGFLRTGGLKGTAIMVYPHLVIYSCE